MKFGNTFHSDESDLTILIVGQDDDIDYIYFCSLTFQTENQIFQLPFIPIHKDVIQEFVDRSRYLGNGRPVPILESIEKWIKFNKGGKTFFTTSIENIWNIAVSQLNSIKNYEQFFYEERGSKKLYLLPIIFPTSQEFLNENLQPQVVSSSISR